MEGKCSLVGRVRKVNGICQEKHGVPRGSVIARLRRDQLYFLASQDLLRNSMSIQPNTDSTQFGLTEQEVQFRLNVVKVRDVDYADVHFESCRSESVRTEAALTEKKKADDR